jgi:hypothetical protein
MPSGVRSQTLPADPELRVARERSKAFGQRTGNLDGALLHRAGALVEHRRQRHQVELGCEGELRAIEELTQCMHAPLELRERRLRVVGDARRLERGDEERPLGHHVILRALRDCV